MNKYLISWMTWWIVLIAGVLPQPVDAEEVLAKPTSGLGLPAGFWTNDTARAFTRWVRITNHIEVAALSQQVLSSVMRDCLTNSVLEVSAIRDSGFFQMQGDRRVCFYLVVDASFDLDATTKESAGSADTIISSKYPEFPLEVRRKLDAAEKHARWEETIVPEGMHDTIMVKTTLMSSCQFEMVVIGLEWWMEADGYKILRNHDDMSHYMHQRKAPGPVVLPDVNKHDAK